MRLAALTVLFVLGVAGSADAQTADRPQTRVVGGTTSPAPLPWQAAILREADANQFCGGTVLGATHVVTADHCRVRAGDFVRVGSTSATSGGELRTIAEVRRHPLADGRRASTARYDINVVRLATPLSATSFVNVVASNRTVWSPPSDLFTISGWGKTAEGPGPRSPDLRQATVHWISDADCATYYPEDFSAQDMVCAGEPAGLVDTCQGDSGGPLVTPAVDGALPSDASQWTLVGVTSWGVGCARPGQPGVYARLAAPVLNEWLSFTPPVSGGAARLTGRAEPGQTLTCTPAAWSGGSAYESQRFWRSTRSGEGLELIGESAARTYRLTAADAGRRVWCDAQADNAVATVTSTPSSSATVTVPATPAPAPAPLPEPAPTVATSSTPTPRAAVDTTAPTATLSSRRCTSRGCRFVLRTADGASSSGVATVAATLTRTVRGRKRTSRLQIRRLSPVLFELTSGRLARGSYTLTLRAIDRAGNRQRARTVRFRIR